MSKKNNTVKRFLITVFALLIVVCFAGSAGADVLQIKPKKNKKIRIAVMDLISSIEVAAIINKTKIDAVKARGWDIQIFDLKANYAEAAPTMENIIAAGYDGIMVNWVAPRYWAKQAKKAFDKGIPIIGDACMELVPGLLVDFEYPRASLGSHSATYIAVKLNPEKDKILMIYDSSIAAQAAVVPGANAVLDHYKYNTIKKQVSIAGGGDPHQAAFEMVKNTLITDNKKEIKGIWTSWEGYGVFAAKAAMSMGREDIIVTTVDDSANTYEMIRTLPTLHAAAGGMAHVTTTNPIRWMKVFDDVFAGKPYKDRQVFFVPIYLVTKENLPPKGYYFRHGGYKGLKPDFVVK